MNRVDSRRSIIIALGILLGSWSCAFALNPALDVSQYAHTAWKVSQGFSKGVIFSMAQTADGYLWIGTDSGLFRFDGVRSVEWRPPAGDQLASSDIRSLLSARDGRLWIGTVKGLASWKDGKLAHYAQLDGLVVVTLLEDREGTIWAGSWSLSSGRLCRIQSENTECIGEDGRFGSGVTALCEDGGGNLWAGAITGLWRWKPGPPKLYAIPGPHYGINALIESDDGGILVAKDSGIVKLRDGKAEVFPLPAGGQFKPGKLFRDRHGALWIGAVVDSGLLHIHQGKTDLFTPAEGVFGDLSGGTVRGLLEDREGNIWVATGDGVDRFRDYAVRTISVQQGLSGHSISSVLAAKDGSIWMGASNGLNQWRNGNVTVYRKRNLANVRGGSPIYALRAGMPAESRPVRQIIDDGLPSDSVDSLFEDSRGQIWVTTHSGVAILRSGRFSPVSSVPQGIVLSITEDQTGTVWLSHQEGLFRLVAALVVERIPWAKLGRGEPAVDLRYDASEGGLWLGFSDGDVVFFKQGQLTATYALGESVGSLHIDAKGTLWAATTRGLARIKGGRVLMLTSHNGLPCNTVHWMMEGDADWIWLYTACGLVRMAQSELDAWASNPKSTIHPKVFDSVDGVRSLQFHYGRSPIVAKDADDELWFLPFDGVSVLDPHHLQENKLPPPVHIEHITADGNTYDASNALRLPPRVRNLSIAYTALSLVAPEKVRFRYKLEGQDEDWREVVNDRRVQYSNLSPRTYRFRVRACNNSGVWNEEGASLEFVIPPAWYQTNWFLAACVAAFLGMIWGMYQLRVRQLQRNVKKLRDVVETIPAMVFEVGPDGTGAFANRRWLEYTGFPLRQQGRFAPDNQAWRDSTGIHPDDLDGYVKLWERAIATGEPFELETRVRRADGVYRLFLARHVPLRDEQGKILKWYGTLTDIEERKRAEQELRESETRFRTFVDHAGDALFVVDVEQGTIVDVNRQACESLGYTREELIGKTPVRFHLDSDHAGVEAADKRAAAGEPVSDRHWHRRKDGATFPVEVQTNRVSYGGRHFLLKVARDISDRVRAEEQREKLRQVEADLAHMGRVSMLGELVASLAHELNQPITGAITSANACLRWLGRETPEVERARAAAMRIEKDGNRAAGIISRLRAFYKKGAPPQRESVVLGDVIDDITVLLRNQASRYSITIRTELAVGFPNVFADRVQLQQVFMNLMLNAIDAMKDTGGELTVRSQPTDNALLMLSVTDTGVGLPAENADQIFKAFFTTKPQGTGMGLAITRSIVEAHGGRLWASNNAERGATFYFTLPADAGAMNEQSAVADGFHH